MEYVSVRTLFNLLVASAAAWTLIGTAYSAAPCTGELPYQIELRAEPLGETIDSILPLSVGRFARDAIEENAKVPAAEDFNVTYRSGRDEVFLGVSRPGSIRDLEEAVRTSREDAVSDKRIDRRSEVYCIGNTQPFYKLPNFIAWINGSTFLYAEANSQEALDEFMMTFSY